MRGMHVWVEGCGYEECACVSKRGVGMRSVHVWV